MASITYWNRLIPTAASLEASLAARVADPVFILGRQGQLGEFLGADCGSPAFVQIGAQTSPLTPPRIPNQPLEPALEAEPVTPDLALRVELGLVVERLIDEVPLGPKVKTDLRTRYPIAPPAAGDASSFLTVCQGRAPDGAQLYADVKAGTPRSIDPATDASLKPVFLRFAAWVDEVFGAIGTAAPANWDARTLSYQASLPATLPDGRSASLIGEPDRKADLEWYAFDVKPATAGAPGAGVPVTQTAILPMHVRFRGMPNSRFWDFESSKVEYGNIVADVADAGRLVFLDFMLIHGSGWYVTPFDVPVGSICRVQSLSVRSVFGDVTPIARADASIGPPGARATYFSTTDASTGGVADFLLVAPSCSSAMLTSPPIEDVRLFRDDAADLAWAVEDIAPDAQGLPVPGSERGAPPSAPAPLPILRYQLETPVPAAWFPLLPQDSGGHLVDFLLVPVAGSAAVPFGRVVPNLVSGAPRVGVPEQQVSRAGLRLQRVACRSRWIDGSTWLWYPRRRLLGARGPSSGLAYDQVHPART